MRSWQPWGRRAAGTAGYGGLRPRHRVVIRVRVGSRVGVRVHIRHRLSARSRVRDRVNHDEGVCIPTKER